MPLKRAGVVQYVNTPCFEPKVSAFSFSFCALTELCSPFVGLSNNVRSFSGSREKERERGNTDVL